MKLAIFAPNVLPVPAVDGGAVEELTTYIIEENERKHFYDIDLYTVDNDNKLKDFHYNYTNIIRTKYKANRFKTIIINMLNHFLVRTPNGRVISDFSEYITRNFKKNYYDIVLVEDNRQVFNSIARKIKHEKLIFHVHDDIYPPINCNNKFKILVQPMEYNMIRGIIRASDKIITVSHYLEERFNRFGAKNTTTLYNGILKDELIPISLEDKSILKKKYGISRGDTVFTFIGRFVSDKGIDKLLSALTLLKNCKNLKCLIVGKNWLHSHAENEYTSKLKRIMNEMSDDLKSRIIFTGYVDHKNINEIYSISDCIVIPSQCEEAFGVVALEAMSMGIPVIASKSGGLTEVVANAGLMVERGNNFVPELAKTMKKVYANPALRESLSEKGKRRSKMFPQTREDYFNNFCRIVT